MMTPDPNLYLAAIKKAFNGDPQVLQQFIILMEDFKSQRIDVKGIAARVQRLFKGHDHLILGFNMFLPPQFHNKLSDHKIFNGSVKTKRDICCNLYADRDLDNDHRDMTHGRKRRLSEDVTKDDNDKGGPAHMKKYLEDQSKDSISVQSEHQPLRPPDTATELLSQVVEGAESLGLPKNKIGFKGIFNRDSNLFVKIDEMLEAGITAEILKCLEIYSKKIISRTELMNMVNHLLEKYPDLMDHFEEYLAHCEKFESFWTEEVLDMPKLKIRDKAMWRQRNVKKRYCQKRRDKEKEIHDKYSQTALEDAAQKCSPSSSCKEKDNICKSVLEAGPTPSYHYVERNNLMPQASHRTKLDASVLNDELVCKASTSGTSKKTSINSYEDSFFQSEDDRFELDMLLKCLDLTTKQVEELLQKIQDDIIKGEMPIRLEDHFTSSSLRFIEHLYSDYGLEVLDAIRANPGRTLYVILPRLKQKEEEWFRCRSYFNKVWAEVDAKYHYNLLDHRTEVYKEIQHQSFVHIVKQEGASC